MQDLPINEDFLEFNKKLVDDGGTCEYKIDDKGEVAAIFLSSASMKKAYKDADVPLLQVDTTFQVESSHYKVVGVCYLDPKIKSSAAICLALVDRETKENLEFVFEELKKIIGKKEMIFVCDKDFTEMDSIRKVFKNCRILLCRFHVVKYVKSIISTAVVDKVKKEAILSIFKHVVWSRSRDDYEKYSKSLLAEAADIEVFPPGNQVKVYFNNYFIERWASCKDMWAAYCRGQLVTLGDNTNNRIERRVNCI